MEAVRIEMPVGLNTIQKFLGPKKLALAGASRNEKKFGGTVLKELTQKGYEVYPVNPNATEIQGQKCYNSLSDLPASVKHLLIVTPKSETLPLARQAVQQGMEMIWIQQMSETPETLNYLRDAGVPLIAHKCILMFADPVKGPHQFHRFFVKLFGRYPK